MPWCEARPGVYERPAGENEQFIKFIGDRAHPVGLEHWSLTVYAKFKPCDDRGCHEWNETLRQAWKLLRFRHPSIASILQEDKEDDNNLLYVVPDDIESEKWLKRSFFIEEDSTIGVDEVGASSRPCPIVTMHWLPARWQVVMRTPHWRTDGYGAFQLLDAFFECIIDVVDGDSTRTKLDWGSEYTRLVPSVEEALTIQNDSTAEIDDAAKKYLGTVKLLAGTVGLPLNGDMNKPPGYTSHVRLQLSQATTSALEAACTQQGFSIYSAIHATVAAVNWLKATPDVRESHYASTIRLSLRQHLPVPYDTSAVASGLYTGGYTYKIQPGQSLVQYAKEYQKEYDSGITPEFLQSRRQYAKLLLQGLRAGISPPPPPVSNIDVSFVEDVDGLIEAKRRTNSGGVLEVQDIGLGVNTLTRQPYCFYWKFQGRIDLQLWYNESYYDEGLASEILELVKDVLSKQLLGSMANGVA